MLSIGFVLHRRTARTFRPNPLIDEHLSPDSVPRKLALFCTIGMGSEQWNDGIAEGWGSPELSTAHRQLTTAFWLRFA
jgi:hypothetical protein